MSEKRSLRVSKDFGASKLANCFVDKASASYQNSPDFVEVFAFCNKIGKFFNIPSISFVDLEQALDYETQNQGFGKESWVRSKTLYNLYKGFLGCVEVSEKLQTILSQSKSLVGMDFYGRIPSSFMENHATADVCSLQPEHKLAILCAMIDSLLSSCNAQEMSENIPSDVLCIVPLAVDSSHNKLWYFGDTYLFLERAKGEKWSSAKKSRASSKVQKEVNEANARLFLGGEFVIICKTSSDWTRLIEAYEQQGDVAETLSKQLDGIVALENKRLRQEILNSTIVRASSRIAKKTEEKKRDEEIARQRHEEEMRRKKVPVYFDFFI
ncbi:hypothetical protein Ddc_01064 [Ditylenchus destructor]|nr:hypothetical protein Ddc_01064 [Ditylenchus destructor]